MACRYKAACSPRRFPERTRAECASRVPRGKTASLVRSTMLPRGADRSHAAEGASGRWAGANGILARTRRGGRARFKAHAWRACKLGRVSGVQIPPSPPTSPYILPTLWARQKLRAGMWRSFSPLRTGENRLTPDSPDSASILSVRSKNGSLQRPGMRSGRYSVKHRHSGAANQSRIESPNRNCGLTQSAHPEMSVKEAVGVVFPPQSLQTLPICLRIRSFCVSWIGYDVRFAHIMADRKIVQVRRHRAMPCAVATSSSGRSHIA